MVEHALSNPYASMLERWTRSAQQHVFRVKERPDLQCYGTGFGSWGVQTNQKAFAAFATLAAVLPSRPAAAEGLSKQTISDTAVAMLRYSLSSHIEGNHHNADGTKWGHTWISALGIERMMHGVEAIQDLLTEEDFEDLRRVLVSEADWIATHYEVVGHPDNGSGRNKPESNLWNGALLHRVASLYPDLPQAEKLKEQGSRLLVNSISIAADAANKSIVDGRPISEWFVGDNFFPSYALHHHGYLNVGYMVICLSNVAMLHFDCKRRGVAPPEALYHRARELWELVRELTFPDGRLLRIGGDTRVPYTYCQDYMIPVWLLVQDLWGEHCGQWMAGWSDIVRCEQAGSGDGGFLTERCRSLFRRSPYYYTRLESDRAVTLSMAAAWGADAGMPDAAQVPVTGGTAAAEASFAWSDAFHGALFHRSPKRIASWVWHAAEKPQGLCLPPDDSSLAEWRWNLAGRITGLGTHYKHEVSWHREAAFEGGFLTCGEHHIHTERLIGEGMPSELLALQRTAVAALPDDKTMLVLQYARSPVRSYVESVQSLLLQVPNDLFNGCKRTYYTERGVQLIEGAGTAEEEIVPFDSSWANVEDAIGIVVAYGGGLKLYRPGRRNIAPKRYPWTGHDEHLGTLYADALCVDVELGLRMREPGDLFFDLGAAVRSGDSGIETRAFATDGGSVRLPADERLRLVQVRDAEGMTYLLAWNVSDEAVETELPEPGERADWQEIAACTDGSTATQREAGSRIRMEAGDARLFRIS